MATGWVAELAERIWRAERTLQIAQRNLRSGTDEARESYARALHEMEDTHRLVSVLCGQREQRTKLEYGNASEAMA